MSTTSHYIAPRVTTLHHESLHCTTSHYIAPRVTTLHHESLHCTTSHHIAPRVTTLHHESPHCTTSHHIAPRVTTLHHESPHCTTSHYTAPRVTTLHHESLHCTTSHYIAPRVTTLHHESLHCTTSHYIALRVTTLHHESLLCTTTTMTSSSSVYYVIFFTVCLSCFVATFELEEDLNDYPDQEKRTYTASDASLEAILNILKSHAQSLRQLESTIYEQKRSGFRTRLGDELNFGGVKRRMVWQPLGYLPASARVQHGSQGAPRQEIQDSGSSVFRYG
ncbi:Bradykinin-like neuropeptide [Bulinus truncatus]|nr:Bradykinin-like neuropeptide [Bulinus truncatus]